MTYVKFLYIRSCYAAKLKVKLQVILWEHIYYCSSFKINFDSYLIKFLPKTLFFQIQTKRRRVIMILQIKLPKLNFWYVSLNEFSFLIEPHSQFKQAGHLRLNGKEIHRVIGDGHCLFRAIAYFRYGNEKQYRLGCYMPLQSRCKLLRRGQAFSPLESSLILHLSFQGTNAK